MKATAGGNNELQKSIDLDCGLAGLAVAALGQSITVNAPNGGERWLIGDPVTITWTATGLTGNVRINLLRTGGATVGTIATVHSGHGRQLSLGGRGLDHRRGRCRRELPDPHPFDRYGNRG